MMSMPNRPTGFLTALLLRLCQWLCLRLPARDIGLLFERLQMRLAGRDQRIGRYALDFNNPQAWCFLMAAYPSLQKIFAQYPRMGVIRLLDIGPAFGAAGGLLSQMHRSEFLGPKVVVDALDIVDARQAFIEMTYPLVNFLHADLETLPAEAMWDVVYCSNTIEHLDDPCRFIRCIMQHTRGHAVFLAPYREADPLSPGHLSRISEDTFAPFQVEHLQVLETPAWPTTADGVERQQILVVLSARS